jgi:hypothetical protein
MPWGSRVWVIQEYVLSKRTPWALLDSGVFALDFTKAISSQMLPQLTEGPKDSLRDILNPILASFPTIGDPLMRFTDLRGELQFENFWDKSLADQLLHLLLYKCGSRCAIAHDHIYGILSLVDVKLLPERLRPDYSEPFETVYFKYMRYIVQNTHSLALLDISAGYRLRGCPTWVPDFGYLESNDIRPDPLTINMNKWFILTATYFERRQIFEPFRIGMSGEGTYSLGHNCSIFQSRTPHGTNFWAFAPFFSKASLMRFPMSRN